MKRALVTAERAVGAAIARNRPPVTMCCAHPSSPDYRRSCGIDRDGGGSAAVHLTTNAEQARLRSRNADARADSDSGE
jgi:hypothetical protein